MVEEKLDTRINALVNTLPTRQKRIIIGRFGVGEKKNIRRNR